MKRFCTLLFLHVIIQQMNAQSKNPDITGEYYLQGVMETASDFKLNADSTF